MCSLRRASIAFFIATVASIGVCQESGARQNPSLERVNEYRLVEVDGDRNLSLQFVDKSLLNWSNPVYGTTDGGLYLWTRNERPSAVMKSYKAKAGIWFEQVRSFSRFPIVARESKDGKVFWSPPATSDMKPIDDAPSPATTPAARLSQMKQLHNTFKVTGTLEPQGQLELRPLPTPIYRYQSETIVDGAVLLFVQGTGPDMLLILEVREVDGKRQWFYELGSIGIFAVEVVRNGEVIWKEARRDAPSTRPTDIYDGRRLP